MITPSDTPSGSEAICKSRQDPMLVLDKKYTILEWHSERVVILLDGKKHWTKSSYLNPVKK